MQTNFTAEQLRDPDTAASNQVLRTCVHCGFCTATCPTFVLLGDELDSPRGRIYLIKDMLESGRPATEEVVRHVDRCLSCLSCMTTCPSGVNYMHLVDHARALYRADLSPPLARAGAARGAGPRAAEPALFRLALPRRPGWAGRWRRLIPGDGDAGAAAARDAQPGARSGCRRQPPRRRRRCIAPRASGAAASRCWPAARRQVLAPAINEATIRLLTRLGVEVVVAPGAGCCGALTHHMGQHDQAMAAARADDRRLESRDRGRGAGRHRDQHLGLRHHGEGLRLHVPRRARTLARPGRGDLRARGGYQPSF